MNFVEIFLMRVIDITVLYSWTWPCSRASVGSSFRAMGGRDALPGEFPYVVRLEHAPHAWSGIPPAPRAAPGRRNLFFCTASVLSATMTLTAAHCCLPLEEHRVVVRCGAAASDGRPGPEDRFADVLAYVVPPSARDPSHSVMKNDIALARTQPLALTRFARLSGFDQRALAGRRVTVLGHGLTERAGGGGSMQPTLALERPLQVVLAVWGACEREDRPLLYPLVCGARPCGARAALCPGDSGGPVLHAGRLVGVTSMGYRTDNCRRRGANMNVNHIVLIAPLSSNMDWIADALSADGGPYEDQTALRSAAAPTR